MSRSRKSPKISRQPRTTSTPASNARRSAAATKTGGPGRPRTKQAALIALLRRKSGATIAELRTATGWQAHSLRGAISGTLKKKLGLVVTSEPIKGRGRVYRIAEHA